MTIKFKIYYVKHHQKITDVLNDKLQKSRMHKKQKKKIRLQFGLTFIFTNV